MRFIFISSLLAFLTCLTAAAQIGSITIWNGTNSPDGSYRNATNVAETLAFTNVGLTSTNKIDIGEDIDISSSPTFGPAFFNLSLTTVTNNLVHNVILGVGNLGLNSQIANLNGKVVGTNGVVLTGSRITGLATQVNVLSASASLQQSVDVAISTNQVFIQVSPGTYTGDISLRKRVTLSGNAGAAFTVQTNFIVGDITLATNGVLTLTNCTLSVTNASSSATFDVRRGTNFLNGAALEADRLVLTNTLGAFSFNNGSLRTRQTSVTNGLPFVVGNGGSATLELLGNGTHGFANGLQIGSNALFKGNGTINGNVTLAGGGTLSPGASIGKFSVNGNLVLANGSTNIFELNKASRTNDNIAGMTSVTYGGTLVVTNLGGTLTNGDTFKLFSAASYSGVFSGISAAAPGPGMKWNLHRLPVDGVLRVSPAISATPAILSIAFVGGTNFVITASGTPFDTIYLLNATNISLPMTNWTYLTTNSIDAGGNTIFSQPLVPGGHYFRLQLE